ncbi:MAG: NAD-dependent protein deacylase [Alphaproteobacteria bacterium]|nr:NAD-dependent protein deacylase [Alphaproteobacteria bacterium]
MSAAALVVLTGAGISQESGLDTFRDPNGIWSKYRVEDVATPEAFARDPCKVHAFYNMRRRNLLAGHVKPNAAHAALAELERRWPGEFLLVTQNIDDLHERAGSTRLIHMHGEMRKVRCTACGAVVPNDTDLSVDAACDACAKAGGLRPHVVWFGEMPLEMARIGEALSGCDLFVSIGTSGNVYPAASFVAEANAAGARTVELNLEPSLARSHFAETRYGKATEIVPAFVAEVLATH